MKRLHLLCLYPIAVLFLVSILVACQADRFLHEPELASKIGSFARTATARANNQYSSQQATQTASTEPALPGQEDFLATQIAAPRIELPVYDQDPDIGSLAWIHPPVRITSDGDRQAVYRHEYPSVIVRNFIVAADISWNTTSPSSGCGFSLRTHGESRNLNRYLIVINRMSYGHIQFTALVEGQPANLREIYVNERDSSFAWENQSINHLAVAAIDNIFTIYLNQTKIGEIDVSQPPTVEPNLPPPPEQPPKTASSQEIDQYNELEKTYQEVVRLLEERYQVLQQVYKQTSPIFSRGYVGFVAVNHTGQTTCEFSNAWLWDLDSFNHP